MSDSLLSYQGSENDSLEFPEMLRVVRGGSFGHIEEYLRCALRLGFLPDDRYYDVGFRVVALP